MYIPPLTVSINLSVRQFQQTNLVEVISQALADAELDPKWVTVEITESVAMTNADCTFQLLQKLKEMGIQIALDYFGMSYSLTNISKTLSHTFSKN